MSGDSEAREAVGEYKAGWHDPENSTIRFDFGLSEEVVRQISELKEEPEWMTDIRVKAFKHFSERPMPTWGTCQCWKKLTSKTSATTSNPQTQQRGTGKMSQMT